MFGQANFIDEIDCGSFFDHIDDLLDFPSDDVVEPGIPREDFSLNSDAWPSQCISGPLSVSEPSPEFTVPYEDIVQLEWLSSFVEESFSGADIQPTVGVESSILPMNQSSSGQQFRTSSPVSVLESSSSCSGEKSAPRNPYPIGASKSSRVRSKRSRPASFVPRTSTATSVFVFTDSNFHESSLVVEPPKQCQEEQKKKKKKVKLEDTLTNSVRKCLHCEISKTPQWRAGPMGPKTLCNACGVRFKSGRLFPEYRPAASPTFSASLHSNSHKKVLEMRSRVTVGPTMTATNSPQLVAIKGNVVMD